MARLQAHWTGRFEPTPDSVAAVRQIVAAHLQTATAASREAVVLIASELASNVVCHAGTPYTVRLVVGDEVTVEVIDTGSGVPRLRDSPPEAIGGRGLLLVSRFAADWGIEQRDGTTRVWAQVPLER
jgi:anti-sigma regulatory factor (Ser/Thr protein kinase)